MEDKDKVAVIQEQINGLRAEAQRNADSQRKLFQWVIVGVAGVVALREGEPARVLQTFLPLVPILAMIIIAFWLAETSFSFRCGRWISLSEKRINSIASTVLVDYEQALLRWRRRVFSYPWYLYLLVFVVFSAGYYFLVFRLMQNSRLRLFEGFYEVIYTLAVISNLAALVQLRRVHYELQPEAEVEAQRVDEAAPNPGPRTDR